MKSVSKISAVALATTLLFSSCAKTFYSVDKLAQSQMSRVTIKNMRVILIFISSILSFSTNGQIVPVKDSDCNSNLENILMVCALKVKWENVQYFHEEGKLERTFIHSEKTDWCRYFYLFKELPPDLKEHKDSLLRAYDESIAISQRNTQAILQYAKEHNCAMYEAHDALQDSLGMKTVPVKWMSKEELNSKYIKYLFTPEEVYVEYTNLIQHIKSEKETYLRCIDAELAKGDLSGSCSYSFKDPMSSLLPPLASLTKINFLRIFKEFIFNNNEEVLPDELRAYTYLKSN